MPDPSRRDFVQSTAAATAALAFPFPLTRPRAPDPIRVGLIGCGGRGTGAATDCLRAAEGIELVAMGDVFSDRLAESRAELAKLANEDPQVAAGYRVTDDRTFTGFDAYEGVLDAGIDLAILATPPGFRPAHLAAAVAAGLHVFMEKPVAVDPAGVRAVMAAADLAREKGRAIVAGTQRRHHAGYRAVIERVHGGAIGDVVGGQVFWNQGGLWHKPRVPGWSDTEWQLRNWLYFTWLSGDHIVEQHIHNLDVANWVIGAHPVRAVGVGGRQWRTDPAFGHVYDHFAVELEYPGGQRVLSMCRQIDGTAQHVGERFQGTRGSTDARGLIEGPGAFKVESQAPNPYVQEHVDLIASIRAGTPLNEGRQVAESTLTAIMGREAAYTGQVIVWDELLASTQDLTPPATGFGPLAVPPVAMPGRTKVARAWNEA
jgi:predicted dehydrogenase